MFQLQLYVMTIMWLWDLRLIPSIFFSFSFFVLYFQKTVLFSFICQYRFCLSLHYLQHKHITCGLMRICTLDGLIWRKWSLGWWMMRSMQTTHSILTHKTTLYQNFNARLCFLSLSLSLSLSLFYFYIFVRNGCGLQGIDMNGFRSTIMRRKLVVVKPLYRNILYICIIAKTNTRLRSKSQSLFQ